MHAAACAASPELRGGFRGLSDAAAATLEQLLDLQEALLDRIPACAPEPGHAEEAAPGSKRGRGDSVADDDLPGEQLCT
jgi:hypothetical protein